MLPELNVLYLTASLKYFERTRIAHVVKLRRKGALAMPGMVVRREYLPTLRWLLLKAQRNDIPHDKLVRKVQGRHRWHTQIP